ncbi:MAG: hypothetical protein ACR2MB_02995 [Acidimicrobiales bacterium]
MAGPGRGSRVLTEPERDVSEEPRRWPWLAPAVLLGVLPFLVVLVISVIHVHRPWISRGDYALIELSTRSAMHGEALLGPYSKFGWNHPGPLVFYWFAPFFAAFRQAPESLGVATAVLNTAMAATTIVVCGVASGRRAAWAAALWSVGVVTVWGYPWIDHIWNPFINLSMIVATAFLAAAALAGHRWLLVPLAATSTFVVQSHVGTVPIIALIALVVVLGSGWAAGHDWRRWWAPIAAAVGVAALGWALPVHEQLSGRPGNMTEMVRFLRTSGDGHRLGEVLDKVAVQLTFTKVGLISRVVSARRPLPPATSARLWFLGFLVLAAALGIVVNRRAGRRFEQHLCGVALAGVAGVIVAGMRVVGPLEGYLTLPATAVGAVLWGAIALTGTAVVADRLRSAREFVPATYALALLASVWLCVWIVAQGPQQYLQVRDRPQLDATAVSESLRTSIPAGTRTVRIEPVGSGPISTAALVANEIERAGFEVRSRHRWEYLFGRSRRSDGCEKVVVRIGLAGQPIDPRDGVVAATYAGQALQVRYLDPPHRCRRPGYRTG